MDKLVTFDKTAAVGQPAPDFKQNDTAGHPVSLSSFRGKYVLLDFWASWCGPCREENPAVVSAYGKYHPRGLEILGVSLDQKEDSWKKAIRADKLTWTHLSDLQYWNNAVAKLYGVQGVPQNFLIDPGGKIIARGLRGQDLDKKLEEIFSH
jgi:peroxiredoxin